VLSIVVLAMTAAPAGAVSRKFFGVQAYPAYQGIYSPMSVGEFGRMGEARLGTLRLDFNWQAVQPTRSTPRNWSFYDTTMERAARNGVAVLGHFVGSPAFAAGRSSYAPRRAEWPTFQKFVRDVVRRYGRNGSFWAARRDLPYRPVTAFQVWNEVNLPFWWRGSVSATSYAHLLKLISKEIRANDPRATVVLAGLPEGRRGVRRTTYLSRLYRVSRNVKGYFDAVAIHPYARTHNGVKDAIVKLRAVMRRHGDSKTSLWITESGWATGGKPGFTVTTTAGQATKLRNLFRMVLSIRKRYRITRVIWFNWRDLPVPSPAENWWGLNCGLFTRSGNAKPSWSVFRSFSRATS
jgi:hypothetical protein